MKEVITMKQGRTSSKANKRQSSLLGAIALSALMTFAPAGALVICLLSTALS